MDDLLKQRFFRLLSECLQRKVSVSELAEAVCQTGRTLQGCTGTTQCGQGTTRR